MRNQLHREITRLMTQMRRLCSLTVNKRLAVVGSNLHEYAVLLRLAHDPEVAQHELAYDAAIDPAAVSRLVRAMARAGSVTTRVDPTDKRQRFVKLTQKGRALERTLSPVVDACLEPLLSGLDEPETQQFLGLLSKAYDHAVAAASELDDDAPPVRARAAEDDEAEPAARVRRSLRPRIA